MLILISPAKKLDFETAAPTIKFTQPLFLDKAQLLINDLKKCKPAEISKLMGLSQTLTNLNVDRYNAYKTPFTTKNAKQAMFAFRGDTYMGLDADSMSNKQIDYAQKNLRILSGLYGLVSPLDLIQPYRLEMGTRFPCQGKKNLHQYWNKTLTDHLNSLLKKQKSETVINLASKEYFGAVDTKSLNAEVITPVFKDYKNGEYKMISFFAKRARGMMSRYIIDHEVSASSDIINFNYDGYKYSKQSSTAAMPVFLRKNED